jgi:hypothetical protein
MSPSRNPFQLARKIIHPWLAGQGRDKHCRKYPTWTSADDVQGEARGNSAGGSA